MIYAVLFEDDPTHSEKRAAHMPAHLSFLERNGDRIASAGPLKEASDGTPGPGPGPGLRGGLWIVRADGAEEVRALIEADPFWPTGLRKSVRVLEWTQVFADGKRRI